jgi:hypothetical protein
MSLLLCLCGAVAMGPGVGADAAAGEEPRSLDELQPVPFDSATTARYREVAAGLAAAVATGDTAAFRSLHTDSGWAQTDDWWKGMLADQKKSFGRIVRARGPLRGVVRAGSIGVGVPRDGAAILVLFEREAGASMSFVLDDAGKIVKSSLWVQRELAKANTEGVETLWEVPRKGAKR